MRELILELIRLFELAAGCFVILEGRELFILTTRVLERLVGLAVVGILTLVFGRVGLLGVDLRTLELVEGLVTVGRLDVTLLVLLLGVVLLGWRTAVVLAGLLRLTELELRDLLEG